MNEEIKSTVILPDDYGKELIIDLHDCNPLYFTRLRIETFFTLLCYRIDMEQCDLFWWDDLETPEDEKETDPHLKGTSAVQFILTSNITIHTLDILKKVYINLFSCKDFDDRMVLSFSAEWFAGRVVQEQVIRRI